MSNGDYLRYLAEPLCDLVNTFIQEGRFPNHLEQAYVIPIYKKGDCEDPNNYRPISITAALAKIFKKVLREQMSNYLESNKLLTQRRFGCRSIYSTTDALLYATENIRKKLDNNESTAAAFIDLSKALDSIPHEIPLQKYMMLKFDDNAMSMMESFLTSGQQEVTLLSDCSEWIQLYQGVPQGTVLGPHLFNIFVNDMQQMIGETSELVQYADDTMVYTSHGNIEEAISLLENEIDKLIYIFQCHRLTGNANKTEFIIFCKPWKNNATQNYTLCVKNEMIQTSANVKYLGVYLNRNLTYQNEVENILRKMACGIKTLYALSDFLPINARLLLFNALIMSHLHYSAVLLKGFTENLLTTLEKHLNWGIKACFYRNKYDSSSDCKLMYDIIPIHYSLNIKASIYYWKFENNLIPAFLGEMKPFTAVLRKQNRTKSEYFNLIQRTDFIGKCFFKRAIELWNTLLESIKTKKICLCYC